jgi:hypothetical protein
MDSLLAGAHAPAAGTASSALVLSNPRWPVDGAYGNPAPV